ncbi:MAG: hypothetical protein WBM13_12925 [Bacteroidia bacterium]
MRRIYYSNEYTKLLYLINQNSEELSVASRPCPNFSGAYLLFFTRSLTSCVRGLKKTVMCCVYQARGLVKKGRSRGGYAQPFYFCATLNWGRSRGRYAQPFYFYVTLNWGLLNHQCI